MNQNSDICYDSSDEEPENYRPPIINQMLQFDPEINETVASVNQMIGQDNDDDGFNEASGFFSKFYKKALIRKYQPRNQLQKASILSPYAHQFVVYYPKPNLYFLPTTILFERKPDKLIEIRDKIVKKFMQTANVRMPKDAPQEILVSIQDETQMVNYIIRSNNLLSKYPNHPIPILLDEVLSLNPLFQFYESNLQRCKFGETCGIFLYWAYLNNFLSSDYLSESCIKLIVIVYYIIEEGAPNIITQYVIDNQKQLERLQKLYRVNKKMVCELQPELFKKSNFSLLEKRSFYHESQHKFTNMIKILKVPYPVTPSELKKYSDSYYTQQSKVLNRPKEHFAVVKFLKIMQYLQNCIKRSERVTFDVSTRKGVATSIDMQFRLEVQHPIFRNNLCEKLSNDPSKMRALKQQISYVVTMYKKHRATPIQAFSKIFQKQ